MIDVDNLEFSGATTDSRKVVPGSIFIALKGEKADGRDFIKSALDKGAAGIIDGFAELDEAASRYRAGLKAKVAGVTGSAGKTTAKEFLRSFLSALGRTSATEGNYNNHIGLPMTILNCPRDAEYLVLEMGTNHPGEIAHLCDIASPDSGLVTGIGTAHIEFFKTREAIAREKGTLPARVKDFAAVPGDSDMLPVFREMAGAKLVEADCALPWMKAALADVLPGRHNVSNASLAFALASRYGLDRESAVKSLATFSLPGARWRKSSKNGVNFIDDSYNASPDSMKAALEAFLETPSKGRKILVLGDMFELGENSAAFHREVFSFAKSLGFDMIVAVGGMSCAAADGAPGFASATELKKNLEKIFRPGDTVLLKASHGMSLTDAIS